MNDRRRGVGAGTIIMLGVTAAVIVLFAVIALPLAGQRRDPAESGTLAAASAKPTVTPQMAMALQPVNTPAPSQTARRGFSLTAGGTVSLSSDLVKAGKSDVGSYDFSGMLSLLAGDLQADISLVTLENLAGEKPSSPVVPKAVMSMLREGGVNTLAIGFPDAWVKGTSAVQDTREAAAKAGMTPIGAFSDSSQAQPSQQIYLVNGVRVALLHFTQGASNNSSNNLKKDGRTELFPLTAGAAASIRTAKAIGAEMVVVSVRWTGSNSSPTKEQKKLAQEMADAGADVIIGTDSKRRALTAEWLVGNRDDGGQHRTLCCWSLGCLLSENQSNSGMLLHLTVEMDEAGYPHITGAHYTPTFIWVHGNRTQAVSALRAAPDAMNSTQQKKMDTMREKVEKVMNGSALGEKLQ